MSKKEDFFEKFFKQWSRRHGGRHRHHHHHHHDYEPWYDEHADYNTNAKSYYDYLARMNMLPKFIVELINRLLRRNIEVENTKSIEFIKKGDWIDNGECEPDNYDDITTLSAKVILSKQKEERKLKNTTKKTFVIDNGTKVKNDGVWSPNYDTMFNAIDDDIGKLINRITNLEEENKNLKNRITVLENGLQKIIDNLYKSGAITNNNINNFEFKNNRDIATGNINLFGGTADGNSFIKTSDKKTNNDITAGY